jgi:glycosyltransferase involved in cell wall biosynthesis
VLHVAWAGDVGGIPLQVGALARLASGHRICFLNGKGAVADALVAEGLAVRLGIQRAWAPHSLWRLVRTLRRIRPPILHLHALDSLTAAIVTVLALPRAKRVYTEHASRSLRWESRKVKAVYWVLRRTQDRFVALGPTLADALERRGIDRSRIWCIPLFVAVSRRETADLRERGEAVGVVCRLVSVKRVDLLIDVVAEVRRRGLECSGLVVGDGTERAALETYAAASGLSDRVRFVGEQADVLPWLDRIDVFLSTSEVDVYPTALLEAMARGVPVVAMAAEGGLVDLVRSGGLLTDRSVPATAGVVAGLLTSREARDHARERGYAVAAEHSADRVIGELEELYRSVGSGAADGFDR